MHGLFPEKIWVHKVNTLHKFSALKESFTGIEMDIVYISKDSFFDITHPPDPSIGLQLEEYFKQNRKGLQYWLDLRDLTYDNKSAINNRLQTLSRKYAIPKNNIIVESIHPYFLQNIRKAGFRTSYYLSQEIYKMNSQQKDSVYEIINELNIKYPTTYISSEYRNYPYLQSFFPEKRKISWFTSYNGNEKFMTHISLYEMLLDSTVKVLLIKSDTD